MRLRTTIIVARNSAHGLVTPLWKGSELTRSRARQVDPWRAFSSPRPRQTLLSTSFAKSSREIDFVSHGAALVLRKWRAILAKR